jgi:hypothetical protein
MKRQQLVPESQICREYPDPTRLPCNALLRVPNNHSRAASVDQFPLPEHDHNATSSPKPSLESANSPHAVPVVYHELQQRLGNRFKEIARIGVTQWMDVNKTMIKKSLDERNVIDEIKLGINPSAMMKKW